MESLGQNLANAFIALIAVVIAIVVVPDRDSVKKGWLYLGGGILIYALHISYITKYGDCAASFNSGAWEFIKAADGCIDHANPFLLMAQVGIISGFIILLASPFVRHYKDEIEKDASNSDNRP